MKLSKLLLIASLATGSILANDVLHKTMASMEQGMALIQKGFLNNNIELISQS